MLTETVYDTMADATTVSIGAIAKTDHAPVITGTLAALFPLPALADEQILARRALICQHASLVISHALADFYRALAHFPSTLILSPLNRIALLPLDWWELMRFTYGQQGVIIHVIADEDLLDGSIILADSQCSQIYPLEEEELAHEEAVISAP